MCCKVYCIVSGILFGAVAILHLVRAIHKMPVQIGDWPIPIWPSWVGFAVAGLLCVSAFMVLRCQYAGKKTCV